jgi:hypothetical protein
MMGFPCLRVDDKFFACIDRATGNLILKLPAGRVNDLVRTGTGRPFAPNGRVFKEWVAQDVSSWLEEPQAFWPSGYRARERTASSRR